MEQINKSKLNRSVEIKLGGEKRELKFTLDALEVAERMLPGNNIFAIIKRDTYSITEMLVCVYAGLLHECETNTDKKELLENLNSLVMEYIRDNGPVKLGIVLYEAFVMSGLLGDDEAVKFQSLAVVEPTKDTDTGKGKTKGK